MIHSLRVPLTAHPTFRKTTSEVNIYESQRTGDSSRGSLKDVPKAKGHDK